MMRFRPATPSVLSVLLLTIAGGCVRTNGSVSASGTETYVNVHGDSLDPLDHRSGRLSALIFITVDCPIANGYAPQLKALFSAFEDKPVDFYLVHVDPGVDAVKARQHASEYGYEGRSILLDPTHSLVEKCQVKVTPEAALFSGDGVMRYRGRINNWYGDVGRKRFSPSRHELRDAILQVLAGEPVKVPRAEAVGCEIEGVFEVDRSPGR